MKSFLKNICSTFKRYERGKKILPVEEQREIEIETYADFRTKKNMHKKRQ